MLLKGLRLEILQKTTLQNVTPCFYYIHHLWIVGSQNDSFLGLGSPKTREPQAQLQVRTIKGEHHHLKWSSIYQMHTST